MSWILLILFSLVSCVHGDISLTSSPAQIKPPGTSVKSSCQISGYALTSYGTGWIRQRPGKALEWIGIIWGGGSTASADSFKTRFSISRDTNKNELYLDISNLVTEDTAVYYCAKTVDNAFDYWGKGTSVTVTSAQPQAPPSVFPVSQCQTKNNEVTIGCLASGLTSPDANFKWYDPSETPLSTFVQYPAVRSNDFYTTVSHLTIPSSDWTEDKPYKCRVENSLGYKEGLLKKPDPSVLVYTSDLHKNRITLVCEVSSLNVSIRWKVNEDKPQIDGNQTATIQKSDSGNFVHSYLTVSSAVYETSTFTCTAYRGDKMVAKPFTTSKSLPPEPPETGGLSCSDENEGVEEDELSSLWSTASSFIFLFLFSLVYSTVLTLSKIK